MGCWTMLPRANFWKVILTCVLVMVVGFSAWALRSVPLPTLRSYVPLRAGIQGSIMLPWSPPTSR
jgi:hypothetical protein